LCINGSPDVTARLDAFKGTLLICTTFNAALQLHDRLWHAYILSIARHPISRRTKPSGQSMVSTACRKHLLSMLHCFGARALVYSCRHICANAVSHYVMSGTLYAFCCASNTSLPVAEMPKTRPPTAAMLFAASLAVPAWNTCTGQNLLSVVLRYSIATWVQSVKQTLHARACTSKAATIKSKQTPHASPHNDPVVHAGCMPCTSVRSAQGDPPMHYKVSLVVEPTLAVDTLLRPCMMLPF
jgi:hypothetical protein